MTRGAWIAIGVVVALWALLLGLLGVVAIIALGRGGGEWQEHVLEGDGRAKVAVVNISGEIHGGESGGAFAGGAGSADVISQLEQAADDDFVEAIILRLDTPGGAVVASDDIARAVRRVREDVPVVASMADLSASGGYYVAAQAERIVASPSTITGSIGVIAILPNLQGTAEKLGIKPVVLKSGELKDVGSPFKEMSPDERALYQRLLDEAHDGFIGAVASGRGIPEDKVRKLADGRPYSGRQAKASGLVDELGDLDRAYVVALDLAGVDREDARLVELRAGRGFGDIFPFGVRSPAEEIKRELGIGLGLQYLYLP